MSQSETDVSEENTPEESGETWPKLAIRLRVNRTTIWEWRKLEGAPQTANYKAWQEFIAQRELGLASNKTSRGREELLKENLVKKNRLLDLDIANKERKSVDRSEVDALLLHVATLQKTVLFPALENELPAKAEGKSAAEIRVLGREIGDRICDIFSSAIEAWKQG